MMVLREITWDPAVATIEAKVEGTATITPPIIETAAAMPLTAVETKTTWEEDQAVQEGRITIMEVARPDIMAVQAETTE